MRIGGGSGGLHSRQVAVGIEAGDVQVHSRAARQIREGPSHDIK